MSNTPGEQQLKQFLKEVILTIEKVLKEIQSKYAAAHRQKSNEVKAIAAANPNNSSFTLDRWKEKLLVDFQQQLESILDKQLSQLNPNHRLNILDLLNYFNYDEKEHVFTENLTVTTLDSLARGLRCRLFSIDALQAAYTGNRAEVNNFLKQYPSAKDRPGIEGVTLLYAAARNGYLDIVKDLVEIHRCSVNAPNRQHILRAIASSNPNDILYSNDPRAGSTPLHAASYYNKLDIVKYLVEHGADYYSENQAGETVLMNAAIHKTVANYFREILVFGYSANVNKFPEAPINEDVNFETEDGIWEFKRFSEQQWLEFTDHESKKIRKSLIVKSNEKFQREIYLEGSRGVYAVCLIRFLRSGRNANFGEGIAWIRCRGSSFVNLRCYALWQILLTKHPKASTQSTLDMFKLPVRYDSRFQLRLNTWYFCNDQTNEQLDKAMKYRRRFVSIKVPLISEEPLKFNLETFEFTDQYNRTVGFLRWLPKMVSNDSGHKDEIIDVDEYPIPVQKEPTPLTPSRLKEISKVKKNLQIDYEQPLIEPIVDENIAYDAYSDKKLDNLKRKKQYNNPIFKQIKKLEFDDEPEKAIELYINEKTAQILALQQPTMTNKSNKAAPLDALSAELAQNQQEKSELEKKLAIERAKIQSLVNSGEKRNAEYEQRLQEYKQRIERMEQQKKLNEAKELQIKQLERGVQTIEYTNIQKQIMNDFLTPKNTFIYEHLRQKAGKLDTSIDNRVPQIRTIEINKSCVVTLVGLQVHHDEFKQILKRIQTLLNTIQSAKDYYQRHLNRTMNSIVKGVLSRVQPRTNNWSEYTESFFQLFQNKNIDYKQSFDNYMSDKLESMVEPCISGQLAKPWENIREATNQFIQRRPFSNEISSLKQKALDEFIAKHVHILHAQSRLKANSKSVSIITQFVDKIKNEFRTNSRYQGNELKHFNRIPKLLERLLLYFSCFEVQLPLYESADELLSKIDGHLVTTIATSTGSGKSTLLPALLMAEGYDKVIVTQPRRLPCQLICKRVNETMKIDTGTPARELAGWEVSGAKYNSRAKVRYWTDGLLKECLLYNEKFITDLTNGDSSVVFFIDEVHERSVNIDICLALLAQLLYEKPYLKAKIKIIISSATLDSKVPDLFRQHFKGAVTEFRMPKMGTRFPVETIPRPNENIITVVLEICKKRRQADQILCFVSSERETSQCCSIITEMSRGTVTAYPLVQTQHPNVQQEYIDTGSLFFSTTVAETSLTFPSLKYVVDTGMINIPVYDIKSRRTILREMRAAQSTLTQRLGRLGRTQPGEYYSLYNFEPSKVPYPEPQICQSDLINFEFSIRKSSINQGFSYLKTFLPEPPSTELIDAAIQQLQELYILEKSPPYSFTAEGKELAKLPDFGSLAMSKSVLAALMIYNCGYNLICLASILGILNKTNIFQDIPDSYKSPDGDFMTLFEIIDKILVAKQSAYLNNSEIDDVCKTLGLEKIQHNIRQALRRYITLKEFFESSSEFRQRAEQKSNNWESMAKCLLAGYSDNIFISMKDIQDHKHYFVRHKNKDIAILDRKSTLNRKMKDTPVSLVLARDIRYATSIRENAILSFVGIINPQWINCPVKREIVVTNEELSYLNANKVLTDVQSKFPNVRVQVSGDRITLDGLSGHVLNAEIHIHQGMICELKFTLHSLVYGSPHSNFERNLQSITKRLNIFKPLIWRREAENQAEITVTSNNGTCEVTVKARDSVNRKIRDEFTGFVSWLKKSAVINHPNSGLPPTTFSPKIRSKCRDIEERIARVTDSARTDIDLHDGTKGVHATRETRMEVVAWLAICKFDCRLEGGFVRDWIVGHYISRPKNNNPQQWITLRNNLIPELDKEVVPSDLDCHLPSYRYFDIQLFQNELYKYGITCSFIREDWRYILLFDENEPTGPFTMDLIEPHIALTHDRIDFDVNNLSVEKDYTHELGMRIDITQRPYSIDLETIIDNIQNKRFQVLRPRDSRLDERIDKMINIRGWKKINQELSVIPQPHRQYHSVLVPLPKGTLYNEIKTKMNVITNIKILSIEEIRNPHLEEIYEGMKKVIAKQCTGANPNELLLFHGTNGDGVEGIAEDGFDDRYYAGGRYGKKFKLFLNKKIHCIVK